MGKPEQTSSIVHDLSFLSPLRTLFTVVPTPDAPPLSVLGEPLKINITEGPHIA